MSNLRYVKPERISLKKKTKGTGYLIWRELDPFIAANEADGPGEAATITNAFRWRENGLTQAEKLHPSRDNRG